ncbi:hypothetical protein SS50377_23659 [Spironucleus salmonicida]|uniref:Uncharacterized protein n=1 Tax=Spironucleus salmonicida TaxID=348837 RepID=V6LVG8_9EUKA|nr:hypothetical protein SS50377_23659 [Spironucleus salmonicida]|eukprot:EST48642.1 hypothetical protein SS50377_11255 [Spironucleus salmonicida]
MNSEGEEDWSIPIPQALREYLINISSKLHQLQKTTTIIESTILAAPSKPEIIQFLDSKIDINFANEVEIDVQNQIKAIRDSQQDMRTQFSDQLSVLNDDLQVLQRQNKQISDFKQDYEQFRREIIQLKRQTEEIESKSQANLAEYRKEQDLIHSTFTQLTVDVNNMVGGVDSLNQLQLKVDDSVGALKKELVSKYDTILTQSTDSKGLLQSLVQNVPDILSKARTQIEGDMKGLITQERQRRAVEQNYFKTVVKEIQEKLIVTENQNKSLKEDFDKAGKDLLVYLDIKLEDMKIDFQEQINQLIGKNQQVKSSVDEAVRDQQEQVTKLKYFEQTFRNADKQWKQSVADVQLNTSKYVGQLEDRIQEGVDQVRSMLINATEASNEAAEKSEQIKQIWEGEWKKRENLVDDQLISLTKLAEEVRGAVDGETNVRITDISEIENRIIDIHGKIDKELGKKASKIEIDKALYLKVDRPQ